VSNEDLRERVNRWLAMDELACKRTLPATHGEPDYAKDRRPGYVKAWAIIREVPALLDLVAERADAEKPVVAVSVGPMSQATVRRGDDCILLARGASESEARDAAAETIIQWSRSLAEQAAEIERLQAKLKECLAARKRLRAHIDAQKPAPRSWATLERKEGAR
jgi:hypothetical protein